MMETHVTDIARIIQLAVAPVFLLTAIGTILSALNNRLGRIVDRRRVLEDRLRTPPGEETGRVKEDVEELNLLAQRIRLIYHAIMLAVVCALFVCLLVAGAFLGVFITADLAKVVGTLFILAMFALIGSLGMFLREIFLAVKGGRHQLTLNDVIK
jgi:energy-converting hydrogenase Eha subunit C